MEIISVIYWCFICLVLYSWQYQAEFTCSSLRDDHKCSKSITDNADATDLFFSRISFNLVLPLDIWFTTDCICAYAAQDSLQQEIIRDNHSARQAQTNHNRKNKSVKEQIRRIRVIRDRFWTRRESRRRKSLSIRYCLPDSPPRHALIPRLRPGLLSLRSVLASRQRLSVISVESVIEWKALRSCVFFSNTDLADWTDAGRHLTSIMGAYIFLLFLFIDVLLYSRQYKNCGKALSVMLKNCGNSVLS